MDAAAGGARERAHTGAAAHPLGRCGVGVKVQSIRSCALLCWGNVTEQAARAYSRIGHLHLLLAGQVEFTHVSPCP